MVLLAVCGENFYRLTETQCSRCPENSVRPLNEPERMCACENGYSRRQEDQIDQPCVRKLKLLQLQCEHTSLTYPPLPPSISVSSYWLCKCKLDLPRKECSKQRVHPSVSLCHQQSWDNCNLHCHSKHVHELHWEPSCLSTRNKNAGITVIVKKCLKSGSYTILHV